MNKTNLKNEVEEKSKKDFHPIWIYIVGQILVGIIAAILGVIAGSVDATASTESIETAASIGFIIENIIVFIIFIIMYLKKVKNDTKRLTKKNIIFIIIASIIGLCLNFAICALFQHFNVALTNQETVENVMNAYAIPTAILTTFLAPFIEEIVFRYSIGTLIKNKVVFVIVSSVLFGIVHGIGIATLLYILLGAIYSIIYLKNDKNIMSSTIAHIINNAVGTILMII